MNLFRDLLKENNVKLHGKFTPSGEIVSRCVATQREGGGVEEKVEGKGAPTTKTTLLDIRAQMSTVTTNQSEVSRETRAVTKQAKLTRFRGVIS